MTGSANAAKPRMVADRETLRFARAVLNRPYKFTVVLLVANMFVFLLMWQSSGMSGAALWAFPEPVLIAYGAKVNLLISQKHEWWRFVTPMFVHVGLLHLLVNMYSLWIVGPYVEKLYGSAKFIVFWVLTGVVGVVASYLTVRPEASVGPIGRFIFKVNDVPSAGASGALFGLVGVLFVFGIKFRHELPEGFRRAFGTGLLPMIMLNLFIGYMGRGFIDNAAHLGGLVSGALLALVIDYRRPGERSGIAVTWQLLQIAAIALVAVSFIKTVQHYKDPLPELLARQTAPVIDPQTKKFVSYAEAMTDAGEAFYLVLKEHDADRADKALRALESVPQLDPAADSLREKLKTLLIKAKAVEISGKKPVAANAKNALPEQELAAEYVAWSKEYNAWLKSSGRKYGLIEAGETESSK